MKQNQQKINETITVTAKQLPSILMHIMAQKIVPYVASSPGIGKSSIAHQVADVANLCMIDMRLAGSDPTDLNGFPALTGERACYKPFEDFPIAGDELPWKVEPKYKEGTTQIEVEGEQYDGWLILLDELPSAPRGVQAASYKLILDRMTGQHKLHNKVVMMAAGNLLTDGAIVNPLSTALQSRMVSLNLKYSFSDWMEWALKEKFDMRIIGYLNWKPANAYRFDPKHNDSTYPCGRTWEFMNKLIKGLPNGIPNDFLPMITGTVGRGVGREFFSFCKIYKSLPSLSMLLADPEHVHIDTTDMGVMYALSSVIQANISTSNADKLILLIDRMPPEFQVICIMDVIKRDTALATLPEIVTWVSKNSSKLLAIS